MRKLLLSLLLLSGGLHAEQAIPIRIEHAKTTYQLRKGLMERDSLKENQGMLFHYPVPDFQTVWMFGCRIPLSIAFLNEKGQITEILKLKAHPELMKLHGKVDINHIDYNHPLVQFFYSQSHQSRQPAKYSLEMNAGWFEEHGVSVGDFVTWDGNHAKAQVILRK